MQLCVDATIPECFGGVEGQAVYIDTEGSFVPKRAAQIAQAAVDHCKFVATSTQDPGSYCYVIYNYNYIINYNY